MTLHDAKQFCYDQHDKVCNQKYDETLPYSYHLKLVEKQAFKFLHLISYCDRDLVLCAVYFHDAIEDARLTYNDIKNMFILKAGASKEIAEIVYLCTDYKGRTRDERKPKELYEELSKNKLAVFVKLCDIIANTKYSLLQNSSMFSKYKKEYYEKTKPYLYLEEYKDMFNYLEKLYEID